MKTNTHLILLFVVTFEGYVFNCQASSSGLQKQISHGGDTAAWIDRKREISNHRRNIRSRRTSKRVINSSPDAVVDSMVFKDEEMMMKEDPHVKTGVIAYVQHEGKFFGKSLHGWSPFVMGEPITYKSFEKNGQDTKSEAQMKAEISSTKIEKLDLGEEYNQMHPISANEVPRNHKMLSLRLVAMNKPKTGDQGGIQQANFKCQRSAAMAGLHGTFRAFLSSKEGHLHQLLKAEESVNYKIVNIKGDILFNSFQDLIISQGKINILNNIITPIYSFDKRNIICDDNWPYNLVWIGQTDKLSSSNSTWEVPSSNSTWEVPSSNSTWKVPSSNSTWEAPSQCQEWTSSNPSDNGISSDFLYKGLVSAQRKEPCDGLYIVLCIEIGLKPRNAILTFEDYNKIIKEYDDGKKHKPDDESYSDSSSNNSDRSNLDEKEDFL